MKLEAIKAVCGYGGKTVVKGISVAVESGGILCLLGPNGSGKTTFLKTLLGFLKLLEGRILLDGEDISSWPARRMARAMGYIPQAHIPPFPFTVSEVVTMGRTAHLGNFSSPSGKDFLIAQETLESLGIASLADRVYTEISGGERQMVLIARALVQQPEILVMDEPTSSLDFGNQARVLKQINELARSGIGVIMATHSPDHAFLCPGKAALMQADGRILFGDAREVVTEENLRAAYGINVAIIDVQNKPGSSAKACVPIMD